MTGVDQAESSFIRRLLPHAAPRGQSGDAGELPVLCKAGAGVDDTPVWVGVLGMSSHFLLSIRTPVATVGGRRPVGPVRRPAPRVRAPAKTWKLMSRLWT